MRDPFVLIKVAIIAVVIAVNAILSIILMDMIQGVIYQLRLETQPPPSRSMPTDERAPPTMARDD